MSGFEPLMQTLIAIRVSLETCKRLRGLMMAAIPRAKRETGKSPIIRRDHDDLEGNFI
jgi:hypothetical protein